MDFKFSNEIDQKLFDLIIRSEPDFEKCRKEAEGLLSAGANINAKSVAGDVPNCFLLPAILSDSTTFEVVYRSQVIHFFLDNGFNPNLDEGRCGSQTLNHLISFCIPGQTTLNDLKSLLKAGCNPLIKTLLFEDEQQEENAIDRALEMLSDAFQVDFDFAYMLGFSAILECVTKASQNQNYDNINLVTDACNSNIHGIYSFGKCSVSKNENEAHSFSCITKQHRPFEAGLIFECDRTCLLIDPFWGAYCDKELINKLSKLQKIDLGIPLDYSARLISIFGKISNKIEFLIHFWSYTIEISDTIIKINKYRKEPDIQNAASLLVPNGF